MFVTKKKMYKELFKLLNLTTDSIEYTSHVSDKHDEDVKDLQERINYTLNKVLELTEIVEKLQSKKQPKKETKKAKGK